MIKEAIQSIVSGRSLTVEEAAAAMEEIMDGQATPAQIGAFITALRLKGETVEEIIGLARTMRAKAIPVKVSVPVVDTCGTGGDDLSTFNISTAAALVTAASGLKVAKHGNRAMSSQCGSADLLEALGFRIDLDAAGVKRCIEEAGFGFMFAPIFHPAFKHAAAPRREIGIRTVFNILGPLTSPAGTPAQVIGVADGLLVEKIALTLQGLGCRHALVVHGEDGLDEITIGGKTRVCELKGGNIRNYHVDTQELGLPRASLSSLRGGTAEENAEIVRQILAGACSPQRDVVVLNTAAALVAGEKVESLQQGIAVAQDLIDSGAAHKKLAELVEFSHSLTKEP